MFNFMPKPVIQNKLKQVLETILGEKINNPKKEDITIEKQQISNNNLESINILIAEDQIINMKIITQLLKRQGLSFTTAANGLDALSTYKNDPDKISMILMDVQMPVMDGLEATSEIRKSEVGTYRHIPIVAMTAHAMKGDREKFLEAGMDDYLSKPVNPKELYSTIEKYFK